jgi:hypothetical protein
MATPHFVMASSTFCLIAGGGIVSKIWMLEYGGASKVRKAIYMGTPFQGSMNVFGTLSDGWGDFINRRVALSFPALY